MSFLTKDISFLTKSVEKLQADNYLLIKDESSRKYILKLRELVLGEMTLETDNNGSLIGKVHVQNKSYTFRPRKSFWPKNFDLIEDDTGNESTLRFGFFGFTGKLIFNNTRYTLRVDPGSRGLQSHQVWSWFNKKGQYESMDLYYSGNYPKGLQSILEMSMNSCADGLVLTMFAQYLCVVYVKGH